MRMIKNKSQTALQNGVQQFSMQSHHELEERNLDLALKSVEDMGNGREWR
jgi:hypothetical protein